MPSKMKTKRIKFVGTHPKLQTGMYYTVFEYAEATGLDYKRLHNKMYRYPEMTDDLLKPYVKPPLLPRLETKEEVMMGEWLKKSIVSEVS